MPDKYKRASIYITLPDGTKKQLIFTGKTQKEADAKKAKAKAEYEAGLLVVNGKTTFAAWVEEWLATYKQHKVTDSTYKEIRGILDRVYLQQIGAVRLCDLRLIHLQRCLNSLNGYSKSYIHRAYIYAKSCLDKAVDNDLITKSPARGLEEPQGTEGSRRALTAEEISLFVATMDKHKRGTFFGVMLACGLRPGEARALTIYNVDKMQRSINVTSAVQNNSRKIKQPKTSAGIRTIPVPDWFWGRLLSTVEGAEKSGCPYLWPNAKGEPMDEQRYTKSWHSYLREMDIAAGAKLYRNKIIVHAIAQDITPYNLRHTYCTNLAEMGIDIKTAQYLMGHSDIRMTADIYTHVTDNMINSARDKINSMRNNG